MDFDAVIIGSGFGGAVTACRLAQAGYKILVLERGRRWDVADYPSVSGKNLLWEPHDPANHHGWFDIRNFPHMTVWQGAGVGGGSLVYSGVHVEADPALFAQGWPAPICYEELKPYYARVARMLRLQKVPENQRSNKMNVLRDAAQAAGFGDRYRDLDLAISFAPDKPVDENDYRTIGPIRELDGVPNLAQCGCAHMADCNIGCKVRAKNTLDLNYIPLAEHYGAKVLPLHITRHLEAVEGGYRVHFDAIENQALVAGTVTARIVVVSAGSLGSTEILLRSRDEEGNLSDLSPQLGKNWSPNGDFYTFAYYPQKDVNPDMGPVTAAAIDFRDGNEGKGPGFFIEDAGFPGVLEQMFKAGFANPFPQESLLHTLVAVLDGEYELEQIHRIMPWFAQGDDASDGVLSLKKAILNPEQKNLSLDWTAQNSANTINAISNMHKKLSIATGGHPLLPLPWILFRSLVTTHPLGGCKMGANAEVGVVDQKGEVFGYHNLYVSDGSILPKAIGANPSHTIAALAERIAEQIVVEKR